MAPEPITVCHICVTTRNETLTRHLEDHHLNQMLHMEVDPKSNVSVIYRESDGS